MQTTCRDTMAKDYSKGEEEGARMEKRKETRKRCNGVSLVVEVMEMVVVMVVDEVEWLSHWSM